MTTFSPWLIRSGTLLILVILFAAVYDRFSETLADTTEFDRVIRETESLKSRVAVLSDLQKQASGKQESAPDTREVRVPSDILVTMSRLVLDSGGKICSVTTAETRQTADVLSLGFKIEFETTWSAWIQFRKRAESLPYRTEFNSLTLSHLPGQSGQISVTENLTVTVVRP